MRVLVDDADVPIDANHRVFWPDRPPNALFFLVLIGIAFLTGWLFFHGLLRAWALDERYHQALTRTAVGAAISTILAVVGMLPVMMIVSSRWFPNIAPNRLIFAPVYLLAALAAAFLVYPFQLWTIRQLAHTQTHPLAGLVEG